MKFFALILLASLSARGEHLFEKDVKATPDGIVLSHETQKVLVSPHHQGRVLVSAFGKESLGWIDRKALASGKGSVGGLDRFWLGPDGSQFTVFFEPNAPLKEKNWRVPPGIATGQMRVREKTPTSVTMEKDISLSNHLGTKFTIHLLRTITLLPSQNENSVAFRVENTITNCGLSWKAEKGLLSIWSLAMMPGNDTTEVFLPVPKNTEVRKYFEPFQPKQLERSMGMIKFRTNGNWRSKIGLMPKDSSGKMYSYDSARKLLTLVRYKVDKGLRYPHSQRGPQANPYNGDLAQVYNHGSIDRKPLVKPAFYEMESASAMPELEPSESMTHWQEVYHYQGELDDLQKKLKL